MGEGKNETTGRAGKRVGGARVVGRSYDRSVGGVGGGVREPKFSKEVESGEGGEEQGD